MGVAIGDNVVDVSVLTSAGLMNGLGFSAYSVLTKPTLNEFMELPRSAWRATRQRIRDLLLASGATALPLLRDDAKLRAAAIFPRAECTMHLPADIGDYTDFYSSREHATNVGIMFRGAANALQPNWLHLPVGYHGRSSSVVISGTSVVRPSGQLAVDKDDHSKGSTFGPSRLLDFELEMAFFVGGPTNNLGKPLSIAEAEERIFGVVLMNDWSGRFFFFRAQNCYPSPSAALLAISLSRCLTPLPLSLSFLPSPHSARDIQAWEYVPLGPFTAKNFCTSISPWVVSLDALEPFRTSSSAGAQQSDPVPLEYLRDPDYAVGSYNVDLQVLLQGVGDAKSSVISRSNLKYLYWNFKQQLVHHAVTGCNMRAGDLLGTGTISGPTADPPTLGSMLELSWRGSRDIVLENGGEGNNIRKFIKDGDSVVMTGVATHPELGYRIGFGQVEGRVLASGPTNAAAADAASAAPPRFSNFKLYSYWRSSCSYRVRIAMGLKGLRYDYIPVDISVLTGNTTVLLPEHYRNNVNKMQQVPTVECTDSVTGETLRITQSLAIIEFLDEAFPDSASVYPGSAAQRARAREIAEIVNSGIQPIQNLSMLRQVKTAVLVGGDGTETDSRGLAKDAIVKGLAAIEALILETQKTGGATVGPFAAGTFSPSVADICLVPQLYNARRFAVDVEALFPSVVAVVALLEKQFPVVAEAAPEKMPDAAP